MLARSLQLPVQNTEAEGGLYELYWNFNNDAETISFVVRVQTSGWVGFGLSPNGQMPDSDVVIGWVTSVNLVLQMTHPSHDYIRTVQ